MKKKGMSLLTLIFVVCILAGSMYVYMIGLAKINLIQSIEKTNQDMELLNVQQLANMAYSNIYFDNLRQGVRRELLADEIRTRMLRNGVGEIDLSKYMIVVENGDVFVTLNAE